MATFTDAAARHTGAAAATVVVGGRRLAPSTIGMAVGLATGIPFLVVGFAGGHGPRLNRLTGNPVWVVAMEAGALVLLVLGLVYVLVRSRGAAGSSPLFSYLAGWAFALAILIAVSVFVDARSKLKTYGLDEEGRPDRLAGRQAELTRDSHNTLAVVNGFLVFVASFAAVFVITTLVAVFIRSIINAVIKLLRMVGVMKPETIADF